MSLRRASASSVLVLVVGPVCAGATVVQPATKPAKKQKKHPTSLPAAGETPLDGLKAYEAAAEAGDRVGMQHRVITGSLDEEVVRDATADTKIALNRIYKAAAKKFDVGVDDAKAKIADVFDDRPVTDDVGNIDVNPEGDRAVVHDKAGAPKFRMAKQESIWKQDLGGSMRGKHDMVRGIVHRAEQAQLVLKDGMQNLEQGKYKTLDELVQALGKNLAEQQRMDP